MKMIIRMMMDEDDNEDDDDDDDDDEDDDDLQTHVIYVCPSHYPHFLFIFFKIPSFLGVWHGTSERLHIS